jgi:hypothetical protein
LLTTHLEALMRRELRAFERELELLPDEALLWATVPGVTNTVGTLAAHVCGNLQHFVGAVLGSTGYVRDREHEFARRSGSRAELQRELQVTGEVLGRVLPSLSEAQLAADYPIDLGGRRFSTELFLLHLAVHLAMHLGQAGYLRRVLTGGPAASADPVSVREIGQPA